MKLKLALLRSQAQVIVKTFENNESIDERIIDLEDLKNECVQGLLCQNHLENDEMLQFLNEEHKFHPIMDSEQFNINEDSFSSLDYEKAKTILNTMQERWILSNNLTLLEELFPTIRRLADLWDNNRSDFFEELWFILRNNLGTSNLKIIYNDILYGEKTHQKNQLVQARIDGERLPQPFEGGEFEKNLMENYKGHFANNFEITEYDKRQGKLVITSSIKESPTIVMGELYQFSGLQKALLKALFDGIQ
ncbi:MAG: hypothetical protein KAQ98_04655 [Bacteriovoracaceae bacterium]|nr:hypothetical protein [Bacteriovoracaceae bacterium]